MCRSCHFVNLDGVAQIACITLPCECVVYESAEYLLILGMDLASCYPSVTYRIEVACGFSENVCTPELGH